MTEAQAKEKLRNIVAIHEHEGVTPSELSQNLALRVLKGELTSEEAVKKLLSDREV